MGFGGSAVDDGFSFEAPAFPRGGVTVEGVDEPVELLVDAALDVGGAGGELLEHRVGDVGDLGDAVHDRLPRDPEPVGELGAQGGVVDRREGALVELERAGVEGEPAAVG